ncbi:MAG: adenine phosphoribosyltransferase [Oscillospiraceae bacterium]|nr:adenine phosphoribosyltransferase [Oscillospiraceae bacterium]
MDIKSKIRHIKNFPKPGIDFLDITPLLLDKDTFKYIINKLSEVLKEIDFDIIACSEARGFIFGAPVAYALNKGFVPIRKKDKLPGDKISVKYDLEYGFDILEMHSDAIKPGQKVVIVDDILATGGTIAANVKLIEKLGGEVVKILFLIELGFLNGREKLQGYDICSLIKE